MRCARIPRLRVADSPGLVVALRTGHDVEVTGKGGLEEAAAADLLDGLHAVADVGDPPLLGGVEALEGAADDLEVLCEISWASGNRRPPPCSRTV